MKRLSLFLMCGCLALAAAGCTYRGAVYSEYYQFGLDIRTTQESSTPLRVNLGYDRGVLAYVPKRNVDATSQQGVAVSVISWSNLESVANPANAAADSLLRVDAGFISGVAANVASAPKGATVVIVPAPLAPGNAAKDAAASRGSFSIPTTGSPGQRIGAAISPSHYGTDMNTERINNWINSNPNENRRRLRQWLDDNGYENQGITNILYGDEFAGARERIVMDLYIH